MARTGDSPATLVARYAVAIYFLAVLMALMPPLDILLSLQQYVWSSPRWRFGALGLISGSMLLPLVALLLTSLTAVISGHLWVNRLVLVIAGIMTLGFVVLLVTFGLDSIQVRREINPQVLGKYDIIIGKTLIMQFVQIIAVLLIARSAFRVGRTMTAERRVERAPELVAGMVGR